MSTFFRALSALALVVAGDDLHASVCAFSIAICLGVASGSKTIIRVASADSLLFNTAASTAAAAEEEEEEEEEEAEAAAVPVLVLAGVKEVALSERWTVTFPEALSTAALAVKVAATEGI
jgi:hypothetical protein